VPAVRKDFFERESMGRMSALQIQSLNVKLGEMIRVSPPAIT
jgi:hypothetical protein